MAVDPTLQDTLNRSLKLSTSGENAKVRRSGRGNKPGTESAMNLLGSILDDTVIEAEREKETREENRLRKEEEARLQKEREEELVRLEAEKAINAEMQAQEDMKQRQAEMQAQLQREKDIEAGIIDLAEEARIAREEEERKQAEANEKRRKTEAKLQAIQLKQAQETELEELRNEQLAKAAEPEKSKLPIIIPAAVVLMLAAGLLIYFLMPAEQKALYDLRETNFHQLYLTDEISASVEMKTTTVTQEPKPVQTAKRPNSGAKKPVAEEPAKPKPTLSGGKGGLFGKPKGL